MRAYERKRFAPYKISSFFVTSVRITCQYASALGDYLRMIPFFGFSDGHDIAVGRDDFSIDWDDCGGAVGKVGRTIDTSRSIDAVTPYKITHRIRLLKWLGGKTSFNMVKCPAKPADVYVHYDGNGYGIFYVPHGDDAVGCNTGDTLVALAGASA